MPILSREPLAADWPGAKCLGIFLILSRTPESVSTCGILRLGIEPWAMARKSTPNGPQFVLWMPRVLDCLRALGDSANASEAIDWIGKKFNVSDEERARMNKRNVRHFDNQVHWAKKYLMWEGLIQPVESSKRGIWALTERGRATTLTHEASLAIYRKWGAFHREQAREKGDESAKEEREIDRKSVV